MIFWHVCKKRFATPGLDCTTKNFFYVVQGVFAGLDYILGVEFKSVLSVFLPRQVFETNGTSFDITLYLLISLVKAKSLYWINIITQGKSSLPLQNNARFALQRYFALVCFCKNQ